MTQQRTYPEGVTSWIDVEHPDLAVAREFYGGLFGWQMVEVGGGQYVVAQLDGRDVAGPSRPTARRPGTPTSPSTTRTRRRLAWPPRAGKS
jgi:predicted enzyme related to lactoylglutathione lyase